MSLTIDGKVTFEAACVQLDDLIRLGTRLSLGAVPMNDATKGLITHSLMLPWPIVLAWARLRKLSVADLSVLLLVTERAATFLMRPPSDTRPRNE